MTAGLRGFDADCLRYPTIEEKPLWVDEWTDPSVEFKIEEEGLDWIRSRPDCVKSLMIEFPLSCVVRSDIPLVTADNGYGIVTSYTEDDAVSIRAHPNAELRGMVDTCHLTVVGYWQGLDSQAMRQIIEQEGVTQ